MTERDPPSATPMPTQAPAPALSPLLPDEVIARAHATGVAAWPGVVLAIDAFGRWLAERAPDVVEVDALHVADLFLACACAAEDARAIAAFERVMLPEVRTAVSRLDGSPAFLDEVRQVLREKLFVGDPDEAGPRGGAGGRKIAGYSGRGPLVVWTRVVAVRIALTMLRQRKRDVATDDDRLIDLAGASADPELELLRTRYRDAFRDAFVTALQALTPRERTALRLYFIEGLSIDQIGAAYRTHRSTAHRWITRARQRLDEETRRYLVEHLALPDAELDSVIRLVRSELDVSIIRFLEDRP